MNDKIIFSLTKVINYLDDEMKRIDETISMLQKEKMDILFQKENIEIEKKRMEGL